MVQRKRLESLLALITGLLLLAARTSFALVVRNRPTSPCLLSLSTPKAACRNCGRPLFATTDDSSDERELTPTERILENEKLDPATRAVVEAAVKRKQVVDLEPKKYPIDLPSPILLATSMILAIVSTGSLFELLGANDPPFGFAVTAAIPLFGGPTAIFLFSAAIDKATAETDEDDKAFLSGK